MKNDIESQLALNFQLFENSMFKQALGKPKQKKFIPNQSSPISKRKVQKMHFKKRMLERFGYEISDSEYEELCLETKKRGRILNKERGIVTIVWKFGEMNVAYDSERNTLVTIFPKGEQFINETRKTLASNKVRRNVSFMRQKKKH